MSSTNIEETNNQSNVYYDGKDTTTNDGTYIYKNPRIIIGDDDEELQKDPFIEDNDDDNTIAIQIYDPINRYQSKPQNISPLRLLRLIVTVAIFIGWNRYIIRMMWGERSIPLNPNRDRSSAATSLKLESNNDENVNEGGGLRKLVSIVEEDMDGE